MLWINKESKRTQGYLQNCLESEVHNEEKLERKTLTPVYRLCWHSYVGKEVQRFSLMILLNKVKLNDIVVQIIYENVSSSTLLPVLHIYRNKCNKCTITSPSDINVTCLVPELRRPRITLNTYTYNCLGSIIYIYYISIKWYLRRIWFYFK